MTFLNLQIIKEEMMKKFIYIAVTLILMLTFIGCATTAEQRKEKYDLRSNVGNENFVGGSNNLDARFMMQSGWW
jgi:uncharacterized lipoprotein NlpE involved in copper resistance